MNRGQANILKNSIQIRLREGMLEQDIANELDCSLALVSATRDSLPDGYGISIPDSEQKRIRGLTRKGMNVAAIVAETGRSETDIRNILNGRKVRMRSKPQKNHTGHNIFEPWKGKPAHTPKGTCVYFIPQEGRVCGALCKGQRCKDHPQGVAHTIRIGVRTGGGLAA